MRHFIALFFILLSCISADAEPLRIFIRSGPKTHGPGAHDHPSFLKDWVQLLNERGAIASGSDNFPTTDQLNLTDVLVIHRDGGGDFTGEERERLKAFTARGGGLVVIHAGCVAGSPDGSEFYKNLIGGAWRKPVTKWKEGPMNLYFTDRVNPITKDCSNFEMDDEIYYDMDLRDDIRVLAGAYTPKPMGRNEAANKRAEELTGGGKKVSVYDIQPQLWTYQKDQYRAFVCVPGHNYVNFARPNFRAVLLRGIAWAGKRSNVDELCAAGELGDHLRYVEGGPVRPSEAASRLEVHPEFEIKLVASEPLVNKVMSVDWDSKGRMWVCETPEYPNGRRAQNTDHWKDAGSLFPGNFEREPQDKISWLEDTNGDGVLDQKHVFADKLELVTSFVFHKKGIIACAAPDIWLLEDTKGKGVCDKRTKLYTGLGDRDTHAVINNMRWGNDGWIYATHGYSTSTSVTNGDQSKNFGGYTAGVIRFKPDGSAFEQYSSKNSNTWGLNITWDGQVFFTQPTCGEVLMHVTLPEFVLAKGKLPGTNSYNVLIKGQRTFPLLKWEEQAYVQIDQVGYYTAAAGCSIYEGGAWPDRWNYSYFTTEPTINIVSHSFVSPEGGSYAARKETGREENEFIRSRDMWFRPIETRVGPDGALYVVDFYNQAVIHNDTRGPIHGPSNAAVRPDRDHYFSRIWRIQHKQARKLEVPDLSSSTTDALVDTVRTSPNAHTRFTAARLLREASAVDKASAFIPPTGGKALAVYQQWAGNLASASERRSLLQQFTQTQDPWSRSALVAAASERALEFVGDLLSGPGSEDDRAFVSALLPAALKDDYQKNAPALLKACGLARPGTAVVRGEVLSALARAKKNIGPLDSATLEVFKALLKDSTAVPQVLPLLGVWDSAGLLRSEVDSQLGTLIGALTNAQKPLSERCGASTALLMGFSNRKEVLDAVKGVLLGQSSDELKLHILNDAGDCSELECGKVLMEAYPGLSATLKESAFNQLARRPDWTRLVLDALKDGRMTVERLGPGNVSRLRNHPNKAVSQLANAVLDTLGRPGGSQKDKLLSELTPLVEKPGGDAEKGKQLFGSVCATCHKLGSIGNNVGPALDGMGAHSAADLLVAVVDPNREVDPSFYTWNITKTNGETLAGVISQENSTSLQLRGPGGVVEIAKDQIATKDNTKRSLMPEGFEALGADSLRDLMAYLNSTAGRFHFVNMNSVATADTRAGLFMSRDRLGDTIHFSKFGVVNALGVPFVASDPSKSPTGLNIIALKGGASAEAFSQNYPSSVEVPITGEAIKIHLLGGVGGWAGRDKGAPVMTAIVVFNNGEKEEFVLRDGEHFADYNGRAEVPLSREAAGIVNKGQLRLITLDLKKRGGVRSLKLESVGGRVAPVVAAITTESDH